MVLVSIYKPSEIQFKINAAFMLRYRNDRADVPHTGEVLNVQHGGEENIFCTELQSL